MLLVNLVMDGLLQARDDDLLDDDAIDDADNDDVEEDGEGEFKRPVCRVGQQFSILSKEVPRLVSMGFKDDVNDGDGLSGLRGLLLRSEDYHSGSGS